VSWKHVVLVELLRRSKGQPDVSFGIGCERRSASAFWVMRRSGATQGTGSKVPFDRRADTLALDANGTQRLWIDLTRNLI
jgi:hypothetical protein